MPSITQPFSVVDWRTRFQQQARWTRSLRQYLLPRAGLQKSLRLLEVGCGPGAILDEIKQQVSGAETEFPLSNNLQFHGLDIRHDYLAYYASQNPAAPLIQGDAHSLPYRSGAFDLVICHFLLLWVNDPTRVLEEMRRVCRQGGSVLALAEPDYGGRIDYPAALARLGGLQTEAIRKQGADPETGRKLGWMFSQAGLSDIEVGVLGGQWRTELSENEWDLEWQVLRQDLGDILSEAAWRAVEEDGRQANQSGSRILYVPTFYAWGRK